MDEKPVSLKRKHLVKPAGTTTRQCIIHIQGAATKKDEIKALTETSWHKIKSTVQKLSECPSSSQHSFICQEIPLEPEYDAYGFHRECYKRFTNVRDVSTKLLDSDKDYVPPCKKRRPSGNILFPSDSCIICDKKEHWIHKGKARVRDRLVKCVTKDAETTLKLAAEQKEDEQTLRKIAGQDLIAREAHYHQLCRSVYTKNVKWGPALPKPENVSEKAHAEAFAYLSTYIDNEMIENHVIVRMNFLKSMYLTYIQEKYPSVYNPNYKTDKLKDKIIKKYSNILTFVKTNLKHSEIVFCDTIETKTAVSQVYELSSSERNVLERAAGILRQRIIEASENYCNESWPPSKEYLESSPVPTSVTHFLQSAFRSPTSKNMSYLLEQKVNSIGQDICYCVTRGSWQMPKHLLIGTTIHHLTASAEIITLLNRLGHCISYSKVLELETAIAEKILITDRVLPPSIIQANSKFVHYCWDNFDLCEETPSGTGTTHSTHGIVIQERISENESKSAETISIPKVKKRSLQTHTHELPPCHMKNIEPKKLAVQDINTDISFPKVDISHFLWFVCRLSSKSLVPDWFGWLNKTEQNVSNVSSVVEYLRPIHKPATENATIQEVMKRSLLGSEECGQHNTVITMDLATAKKAYAIQWNSPELYKHVFLRLGTFHIICAYFHGLGKLLEGSGFEEIILESGICANGSLQGVMSGKHYNRALRIHATLAEAFDRLLWLEFSIKFNVTNKLKAIENELKKYGICSNLLDIDSHQNGEDVKSLIDDYENERHKIRTGERGLTQQFWLNYIDKVWTALNLLRAVKTNDFNQYKTCLKAMVPLFFSMDQQNYARYLSLYVANLDAIDDTHPEAAKFIRECALSVRRVNRPASGIPVDQTIEQTINRSAKSCGGIIGMSRNTQAYDRWCLTRHERGIYAVRAFSWVNMYDEKDALGKRNRESEIIRSLNDVEKATEAIKNFSNPFEILQDEGLMCLSSGKTIPKETAKASTEMNTSGMTAYQNFVKERLKTGETSFFAPIKRQNLTTFGSLKKVVKVRSASAHKTIKVIAQRNVCAQALMLCHEHNIDVQRIFSYPMGPVPWALASSDGSRAKTNKAVLMHKLESNITTNETYDMITSDFVYIMDGNVLFHCVKNVPETFGMLAQTLFHMLPASNEIHFVTDTYKDISIKSFERNSRGYSDTFNIKGPATKVPKDFHQFLCSDSNKKQLIRLLLSEWSSDKYAPPLKSRKIFFVCEESCYSISSQDGINTDCQPIMNLESSQEEADTRVVLHIDFLLQSNSNSNSNIVVRSTDTDVFILLLYFYCTQFKSSNLEIILFDTGVGDKRKLVNIGKIASSYPTDLILALPGFHAFSGCDSTSAFVRQGKLKPFRLLESNPKYHTSFQILGSSVIVKEDTRTEMEEFTCLMYGSNKIKSVDSLRFIKAKEKFSSKGSLISADENTDMSLLPPCLKSLNLHVTRANYQVMIWKKATESHPDVPAPMHNGWKFENDSLAIDWGEEMFPREIIDVLEDDLGSEIDDEMEDDVYVDIPESYDSNE